MLQQAAASCLDHAIEVVAVPSAEEQRLGDAARSHEAGMACSWGCCVLQQTTGSRLERAIEAAAVRAVVVQYSLPYQ